MVGLALVLLALRARNILICQLDSVVSYSARKYFDCMHAPKSLAFFVCGFCRAHFVISFFFSFLLLFIFCGVTVTSCVRCFLVFQEHGMKFLRVFKLNVGTLYLADGKNQVAYFQILLVLLAAFPLFPHQEYHNTTTQHSTTTTQEHQQHLQVTYQLRKKLEVSFSFLCFALFFFFFGCSVGFVCVIKWREF